MRASRSANPATRTISNVLYSVEHVPCYFGWAGITRESAEVACVQANCNVSGDNTRLAPTRAPPSRRAQPRANPATPMRRRRVGDNLSSTCLVLARTISARCSICSNSAACRPHDLSGSGASRCRASERPGRLSVQG